MQRKRYFLSFFVLPLILSVFLAFPASSNAESDVFDGMVFLGDSTTNSLGFWNAIPRSSVWTGPSGTLSMWDVSEKRIRLSDASLSAMRETPKYSLYKSRITECASPHCYLMTIGDAVALAEPPALLITLGVNGCMMMSEADFKAEYSALLDTVLSASPETRVILNTIFPVAEHARVDNRSIDRANRWISSLAERYGITFIDTNSLLKNKNGFADTSLVDSVDGIHWNKNGCKKIMEAIANALENP